MITKLARVSQAMELFIFLPLLLVPSTRSHTAGGQEEVILLTGGVAENFEYLHVTEVLGSSCLSPSLPRQRADHTTSLTAGYLGLAFHSLRYHCLADGLILTCGGDDGVHNDLSCLVLDPAAQEWLPHSTLDTSRFDCDLVLQIIST